MLCILIHPHTPIHFMLTLWTFRFKLLQLRHTERTKICVLFLLEDGTCWNAQRTKIDGCIDRDFIVHRVTFLFELAFYEIFLSSFRNSNLLGRKFLQKYALPNETPSTGLSVCSGSINPIRESKHSICTSFLKMSNRVLP